MTTPPPDIKEKQKPPPVPLSRMPRTLMSRRWWWVTLLVVAGVLVMGRLGIWQLDRLGQRKAQNTAYLAQIKAAPLSLTGSDLPDAPAELVDRQVSVQGHYDFSQQLVLVQQSYLGRPGAHLVTPLVIDGSQSAVLINRGWIPAAAVESGQLDVYNQPALQEVAGVIQLSQTLDRGRETIVDGPQQQWYRIDIAAIQEQMPYDLLPFYLIESPPAAYQDELPYRIEQEIDLSDGPHLGYAAQWFLFSAILGLGYLRFVSTHTPVSEQQP